jgi:hypothetical protein
VEDGRARECEEEVRFIAFSDVWRHSGGELEMRGGSVELES